MLKRRMKQISYEANTTYFWFKNDFLCINALSTKNIDDLISTKKSAIKNLWNRKSIPVIKDNIVTLINEIRILETHNKNVVTLNSISKYIGLFNKGFLNAQDTIDKIHEFMK